MKLPTRVLSSISQRIYSYVNLIQTFFQGRTIQMFCRWCFHRFSREFLNKLSQRMIWFIFVKFNEKKNLYRKIDQDYCRFPHKLFRGVSSKVLPRIPAEITILPLQDFCCAKNPVISPMNPLEFWTFFRGFLQLFNVNHQEIPLQIFI